TQGPPGPAERSRHRPVAEGRGRRAGRVGGHPVRPDGPRRGPADGGALSERDRRGAYHFLEWSPRLVRAEAIQRRDDGHRRGPGREWGGDRRGRRRLDRGAVGVRVRPKDFPHLDGRRRIARVPRRPHTAGHRRIGGEMNPRRVPLMAGNWKMCGTRPEAVALAEGIKAGVAGVSGREVLVDAPFTAVEAAGSILKGSAVLLGAQNLHWEEKGAFTGEVSAPMLRAAGCTHVIIGHSERRQYFGETDETVAKRVAAAQAHGLVP